MAVVHVSDCSDSSVNGQYVARTVGEGYVLLNQNNMASHEIIQSKQYFCSNFGSSTIQIVWQINKLNVNNNSESKCSLYIARKPFETEKNLNLPPTQGWYSISGNDKPPNLTYVKHLKID